MDQRDGDGGGPGGRGGGDGSVDGGGEGGREDGGDISPGRRVDSLSRGSDSLGRRSGSGCGHDNSRGGPSGGRHNDNGGRAGGSSRHDDNSRRLRARVAALVVVDAIADVDARTAGDTDIDTGAGVVVIA